MSTLSGEKRQEHAEQSTCKGTSVSTGARASGLRRPPSTRGRISNQPKDLRSRPRATARRMEITKRLENYRLDKERDQICLPSRKRSRMDAPCGISQTTIRRLSLGTGQELYDSDHSIVPSQLDNPQYGFSGDQQEVERQEESGSTRTLSRCGSSQEDSGLTDTTGSLRSFLTTSTDLGSRSHSSSDSWTATTPCRCQSRAASPGGTPRPST